MIAYDVATKALDTEIFRQYNIAGMISGITFTVLFSQEKPLQTQMYSTHTSHTQMYSTKNYINFYFLRILKNQKTRLS